MFVELRRLILPQSLCFQNSMPHSGTWHFYRRRHNREAHRWACNSCNGSSHLSLSLWFCTEKIKAKWVFSKMGLNVGKNVLCIEALWRSFYASGQLCLFLDHPFFGNAARRRYDHLWKEGERESTLVFLWMISVYSGAQAQAHRGILCSPCNQDYQNSRLGYERTFPSLGFW